MHRRRPLLLESEGLFNAPCHSHQQTRKSSRESLSQSYSLFLS